MRISFFNKAILLFFSALLILSISATPLHSQGVQGITSSAQPEQVDKSHQSQVCPENECKPYDSRYKGLERVAVYVHLPAKYKYAVECHDQIDECVKRRRNKDFPEEDAGIGQRLTDAYNALPKALHPDNLIALLKTRVEQEVMPHVKQQETCLQPEIIIDRGNKGPYLLDDLIKDPKVLIVDLSVKVFDDTNPRISVLYLHAYRVGGASRRQVLPFELVAIPLDLSEIEVVEKVNEFVQRFDVVTTCEMSQSGSLK